MKKNLFYLGLLSFLAVGCQTEEEGVATPGESTSNAFSITLGFEELASTRMSVTPGAAVSDDWAISWEDTDQVTAWYKAGTGDGEGITATFDVEDISDDGGYATFTGTFENTTATTKVSTCFIYPASDDATLNSNNNYTIDVQEQTVDMSDAHNYFGKNYLYMVSDTFTLTKVDGEFTQPEALSEDFALKHLMSSFELSIVADSGISGLYTVSKATITGLPSKGNVQFGSTSITTTSGATTITLDIQNASALTTTAMAVPFSAIPTEMGDVTVELSFESSRTYRKTFTSTNGVELSAGLHYELVLEVDKSTIGYYLDTFGDITMEANTTYNILDTDVVAGDFEKLKAALSSSSVDGIILEFPYLTQFTSNALYNRSHVAEVYAPMVTSIGEGAFQSSTSITKFELGTGGTGVESIEALAFDGDFNNTDLTIKIASDANFTVSGNTLTITATSETFTFKSITVK